MTLRGLSFYLLKPLCYLPSTAASKGPLLTASGSLMYPLLGNSGFYQRWPIHGIILKKSMGPGTLAWGGKVLTLTWNLREILYMQGKEGSSQNRLRILCIISETGKTISA